MVDIFDKDHDGQINRSEMKAFKNQLNQNDEHQARTQIKEAADFLNERTNAFNIPLQVSVSPNYIQA